MRHFMILVNYTAPFSEIEHIVPEHRNHLQRAVEAGVILFSGPRIPRTGGIVIARAESETTIQDLIDKDPYKLAGVAEYQVVEFRPGRHQPFLDDWTQS